MSDKVQDELRAFAEAGKREHWAKRLREILTPLFAVEVDLDELPFERLQDMARAVYFALPRKHQREWDNHSYLWT